MSLQTASIDDANQYLFTVIGQHVGVFSTQSGLPPADYEKEGRNWFDENASGIAERVCTDAVLGAASDGDTVKLLGLILPILADYLGLPVVALSVTMILARMSLKAFCCRYNPHCLEG